MTGFGGNNVVQLFHDTVFQYEDNLSITRGKHTFKVGFQYFRDRLNTYYSGNNGTLGFFNFTGVLHRLTDADLWLGDAQQNGRGIVGGTWGQRSNVFGVYGQDDWRVTSNLTLNLGLRFQAHTPWGGSKQPTRQLRAFLRHSGIRVREVDSCWHGFPG